MMVCQTLIETSNDMMITSAMTIFMAEYAVPFDDRSVHTSGFFSNIIMLVLGTTVDGSISF